MVQYPPPSPEDVAWDSDEEVDGIADQTPLELRWARVNDYEVAICSLPGNRLCHARRSMVADLETMRDAKITHVFVTCTEMELRRAKAESLISEYCRRDFAVHHYPLENDQVPSMEMCLRLLEDLYSSLQQGYRVAVHCTDGLGRSCLVVVLLAMLLDPDLPGLLAIEYLRQSQGHGAIQTIKQYNFIMDFHKNLAEFKQTLESSPQSH